MAGSEIRKLRWAAHLTAPTLAKLANVPCSVINELEEGDAEVAILDFIAVIECLTPDICNFLSGLDQNLVVPEDTEPEEPGVEEFGFLKKMAISRQRASWCRTKARHDFERTKQNIRDLIYERDALLEAVRRKSI